MNKTNLMLLSEIHRDVLKFMRALHEQNLRMATKLRMYGDKGEYLSSKIIAENALEVFAESFNDICGERGKLKLVGGGDD